MIIFLVVFGLFFTWLVILALQDTFCYTRVDNYYVQNGLLFCRNCNRQVSLSRDYCRSCGSPTRIKIKVDELQRRNEEAANARHDLANWGKGNVWDRERFSFDGSPGKRLGAIVIPAIVGRVEEQLLGNFRVESHLVQFPSGLEQVACIRRDSPGYELQIISYMDNDRNGFVLRIPGEESALRITFPSVVELAPWDALMEAVCKFDRVMVLAKNSRATPLAYAKRQEFSTIAYHVEKLRLWDAIDMPVLTRYASWCRNRPVNPSPVSPRKALPAPHPIKDVFSDMIRCMKPERSLAEWFRSLPDWAQPILVGFLLAVFVVGFFLLAFR